MNSTLASELALTESAKTVLAQAAPVVPAQKGPLTVSPSTLPPSTAPSSPVTSPDPLAQLKDLHLPEAIDFWPPAPGWWLLAFIGLSLLAWAVIKCRNHINRNRYRKLALKELQQMYEDFSKHGNSGLFLQQLSQLLRRVALIAFPRHQVASLQGRKWLQFLADSSELRGFVDGEGMVLASGPYEPTVDYDPQVLMSLASAWFQQHRVSRWEKAVLSRSEANAGSISGEEVPRADS
ncbi:DUF4381 domain-containing protein [Motiliproteus sp. MSK22-1]|uniref:DUF4381 domain-containing protein n=1 Tax=Motiliproteus sp. MSK22-1 TaxID=1897630 RepID=UPI000978A3C3|nr:DUF4381 domain-containing protein [Motiliproteus sp. MSK22-1]OMH33681.1 hypothetical protein BGP75_11785 [Motiliproteus sp. MSK22-1]